MRKIVFTIIITTLFAIPFNGHAAVQDEINARNKQIEEIQMQIAEFQQQILETSGKAKTLSTEIARLNGMISKIQLEIKGLNLAITQTDSEIGATQESISATEHEMEVHRRALGSALMALYQSDQNNLAEVLVKNPKLSDFFNTVKNLDDAQNTLRTNILSLKDLKINLESKYSSLEEKKNELRELKALQESQRKSLDQNKLTKDQLLQKTKGDEKRYQTLLNQSQEQLKRIREQITYLQQSGVTVEEAIKFGQISAIRVGMRPAFLIAILEVESRLGKNVGTGTWEKDMYQCYLNLAKLYPARKAHYTKRAEDEKAAFFKIIGKLGLDPNSVKVSREPNYGCGGAMGPAQFIPTTWMGYEADVIRYTGHAAVSPWNIEDAFMAAAIKLSRGGAADGTRAGEIRAAKAYISGNASCTSSICNYYANLALDKAAIIEQDL